jgi:hypothetical protein
MQCYTMRRDKEELEHVVSLLAVQLNDFEYQHVEKDALGTARN